MRSRSPMLLSLVAPLAFAALALVVPAALAGCGSSGGGGGPIRPWPDLKMSASPDLTMQQSQPDLTMNNRPDLTMGNFRYGCNGLIGCVNNCQDQTCYNNCLAQASPSSRNLFMTVYNCLFVTACPVSNGGVCDDMATNYNPANCDACLQKAQAQGGACYNQLQACVNDKP